MSGFRKCGIFPFNPDAIDPIKYAPAEARKVIREMADLPEPPEDPAVVVAKSVLPL